jgi:APA family basic amino acid/polyamine antiporter
MSHGIINLPALFIVLVLTLLLIRGIRESAFVNGLIVITKVAIVVLFIVLGWAFINPANHVPTSRRRRLRRRAGRVARTTAG